MLSFYVSDKPGNSSTIKFGDYDAECIRDNTNMVWYATASPESWAITGERFGIGGPDTAMINGQRMVHFSPEVPFIYAPDADQR